MDLPTTGQEAYSPLVTMASILLLLIMIQVGLLLLEWSFRFSVVAVDLVGTAAFVITIIVIIRAMVYWDQVGSEAFFEDLRNGIWEITLANLTIVYDAVYQHPACGLLFVPIPLFLWYRRLRMYVEDKVQPVINRTAEDRVPTANEQNENDQEMPTTHNEPEESDEMLSSTN